MPVYDGFCNRCGRLHSLSADLASLQALLDLFTEVTGDAVFSAHLGTRDSGRMLGVCIARGPDGIRILRAFSGTLAGNVLPPSGDWAPGVRNVDATAERERQTTAAIRAIDAAMAKIPLAAETAHLESLRATAQQDHDARRVATRAAQATRAERRATLDAETLVAIDRESKSATRAERAARAAARQDLAPLVELVEAHRAEVWRLRAERSALSAALMSDMFDGIVLTSVRGQSLPLREAFQGGQGLRTGTGDCCAPKLLQAAARAGLRPLSLVEAFWNPTGLPGRPHGQPAGPCEEKCRPILGHLLCGIDDEPGAP